MPVCNVNLEMEVFGSPWVVNVYVYTTIPGGERQPAADGQVEVRLLDIGDIITDRSIKNETGWMPTVGGMVPFNIIDYPWVIGYDNIIGGANRMSIEARWAGDTDRALFHDIRLGTETCEGGTTLKLGAVSLNNSQKVRPQNNTIITDNTRIRLL